MYIRKIISGCQTGADQGGLAAAKELNLETGGCMPKNWRTESGPRPDLAILYNLQEHSSYSYIPRTKLNVLNSDGTLIFGNSNSPGCILTRDNCILFHKKIYYYKWKTLDSIDFSIEYTHIISFIHWLSLNKIQVLNIAGNREEKNPGIFEAVKSFLITAIKA